MRIDRAIIGKRPNFRPVRGDNFYRVVLYVSMILGVGWFLSIVLRGGVKPAFQPTPTPTRVFESFVLEAQAYFDSGKIDDPDPPAPTPPRPDAIDTYQKALQSDPTSARTWAELARIQAYSTSMQRNDTERLARLQDALKSADEAVRLAPDDSFSHAVRAFVLDWYAYNPLLSADESQNALREANNEAVRAYQLDPNNALALAYYAEILTDQQKWGQAEKYALQAVEQDPNSMDTHRAYAYVLETVGAYNSAIGQYLRAAEITPNLTFLYVRIGQNFREGIKNPERALEFFDKAATINKVLGVENPLPYIEIAKTYTQKGQFFAAGMNARKALDFDRTNAHTYGQLGIIFIRARNYEGAMPLLKCAVRGCKAAENELGASDVEGLPLSSVSVAYYYVEYGTVMAFLSRPGENSNFCPEARLVLEEVRQAYSSDPVLISIVEDSEGICRRLDSGAVSASTPTPEKTPAVTPTAP